MVIVTGLLAVISAAAAAGLRIGLPLLIIGLIHTNLWSNVPILSLIHPQVLLTILIAWSLLELFASKSLLGQRAINIIGLIFSPLAGALMGLTAAKATNLHFHPLWLIASLGALIAFVLKIVQVGWFFRLRGLPFWLTCIEDILCICLVFLAFNAPENGGLIALILLWLAIRSSTAWREWYFQYRRKD
ncbi:MAG: hypothetical protein N5P05_001172 [Chroococcopsis gigantea SAG 12.99]|jgi:hypothetical protein|nr:hypothetical protein [Chroococcopsis gigantea SAG 12.99]